jgi:hypothetical protein
LKRDGTAFSTLDTAENLIRGYLNFAGRNDGESDFTTNSVLQAPAAFIAQYGNIENLEIEFRF